MLISTRLPASPLLSLSLHLTMKAAEAAAKAAAPTPSPEVTQAAAKVRFLHTGLLANRLHYTMSGLTACISIRLHQSDLSLVPGSI